MRKTIFVIIVLFNLLVLPAQQEISVGVNVGVPVGNTDDFTSIVAGLDAEYVYDVYDQTIYAGISSGFINAFTDNITVLDQIVEIDNLQFIPISAAGRYYLNYTFIAGIDVGYALGINDGNDGGFYFKPKMAFGFTDNFYINLSYAGVVLDEIDNYQSTLLGIEYRF